MEIYGNISCWSELLVFSCFETHVEYLLPREVEKRCRIYWIVREQRINILLLNKYERLLLVIWGVKWVFPRNITGCCVVSICLASCHQLLHGTGGLTAGGGQSSSNTVSPGGGWDPSLVTDWVLYFNTREGEGAAPVVLLISCRREAGEATYWGEVVMWLPRLERAYTLQMMVSMLTSWFPQSLNWGE